MPLHPNSPHTFNIFNQDLNEESFRRYSKKQALAIDTEAMGLIHGRDRLCLVQICDESDNVTCIRIEQHQTSAPLLKNLMEDPSIQKVFHFARFDIAAMSSNLGIKVNPNFCTKVASKLGRTYSPRHGLKEVIMELVNVELDKQAQSSDWGEVNELTDKQLMYAANDVRYLLKAKEKLELMLKREDRWELAQRCFQCIPVMSDLDINRFGNIFEH
ncbi:MULTISPECIES: ribonuclease D [Prochlorococcus]|uniref:ribonuclease D n=1 Tax=Prochlorococcus TaxID=1218 RepID=UPI000533BA23|nr:MULTISPECIES: ribonuclease D [Prochlorococcus]KGG13608.1 Ribonuclease D related protein [Prochlorococcus sp. MIT 0601]